MRLNEDDISKLKVLETLDHIEGVMKELAGGSFWRHPFRWMMYKSARRQAKKLRAFVQESLKIQCQHRGPDSGRGYFYHCDKPMGHDGDHGFSSDDAIVQWP